MRFINLCLTVLFCRNFAFVAFYYYNYTGCGVGALGCRLWALGLEWGPGLLCGQSFFGAVKAVFGRCRYVLGKVAVFGKKAAWILLGSWRSYRGVIIT